MAPRAAGGVAVIFARCFIPGYHDVAPPGLVHESGLVDSERRKRAGSSTPLLPRGGMFMDSVEDDFLVYHGVLITTLSGPEDLTKHQLG